MKTAGAGMASGRTAGSSRPPRAIGYRVWRRPARRGLPKMGLVTHAIWKINRTGEPALIGNEVDVKALLIVSAVFRSPGKGHGGLPLPPSNPG